VFLSHGRFDNSSPQACLYRDLWKSRNSPFLLPLSDANLIPSINRAIINYALFKCTFSSNIDLHSIYLSIYVHMEAKAERLFVFQSQSEFILVESESMAISEYISIHLSLKQETSLSFFLMTPISSSKSFLIFFRYIILLA
jgi:hypothetical protein